jgi:hypothetical protein
MRDLKAFIHERAERLALVYLTRSEEIAVEQMQSDYGLDMLVTILRDKLPTGRIFGVQVKGRDGTFQDIEPVASRTLPQREKDYFQDLPFPVCVLLFTMEDDKGYYTWLKYSSNSNKSLPFLEQNQWRCLDSYPVKHIIEEVNAWYDEKSHPVTSVTKVL